MAWFEIRRRIDLDEKIKIPVKVYGSSFVFLLLRDESGNLKTYVKTSVSKDSLSKFFQVDEREPEIPDSTYYYLKSQCTRRSDLFERDLKISDLPSIVDCLPPNSGVAIACSLDSNFSRMLHHELKHAMKKKIKYQRVVVKEKETEVFSDGYPTYVEALNRRLSKGEPIYLVEVIIFSPSKEELKDLEKTASTLIFPPPNWKSDIAKNVTKLLNELKPPKLSIGRMFLDGLDLFAEIADKTIFGIKYYSVLESVLEEWLQPPDPLVHKAYYGRGLKIPNLPPKRHGIKIGTLENGEEVWIDLKDLERHVHVIGGSGYGKSTFLKLLVLQLHKRYPELPIFVIDPHGNLADELAQLLPNAYYFHPIKAPFGVNPFEMPEGITDKDSLTLARSFVIDVFSDVLELPEEAQYVKMILRTVITLIHEKGIKDPTIGLINKVISEIRKGSDKILVSDDLKPFVEELRRLDKENPQSYISTLARLEMFAGDKLFREMTRKTTVPFEDIILNGRVALFSIPVTTLGQSGASLIASTILLKIWFKVIELHNKMRIKTPIFVICDEFQLFKGEELIETLLTQSRKYNLRLVVSHQYKEQLCRNNSEKLWNAVLSNTGFKVVFRTTTVDVFSKLDPSLSNRIEKVLAVLPKGYALVQLSTDDERGTPIAPFVVKIDYPNYLPVRDLNETIMDFAPPRREDPTDKQFELLFNPILRMIEEPNPVRQLILLHIYESGELPVSHLHNLIPASRDKIESELLKLERGGFVVIEKPSSRLGRVVKLKRDAFEEFYKVAPSEEGKRLIREVVMNYFPNAYIAVPKQTPGEPRPDLIVIPYKNGLELDYDNAIAVELEAHPEKTLEQVRINAIKESTKYFKEIHIQTFKSKKELVEQMLRDVDNVLVYTVEDESDTLEGGLREENISSEDKEELKEEEAVNKKSQTDLEKILESKLNDMINALSSKLEKAIDKIEEKISSIDKKIDELQGKIDETTDELRNEIENLDSKLDEHAKRINELESKLNISKEELRKEVIRSISYALLNAIGENVIDKQVNGKKEPTEEKEEVKLSKDEREKEETIKDEHKEVKEEKKKKKPTKDAMKDKDKEKTSKEEKSPEISFGILKERALKRGYVLQKELDLLKKVNEREWYKFLTFIGIRIPVKDEDEESNKTEKEKEDEKITTSIESKEKIADDNEIETETTKEQNIVEECIKDCKEVRRMIGEGYSEKEVIREENEKDSQASEYKENRENYDEKDEIKDGSKFNVGEWEFEIVSLKDRVIKINNLPFFIKRPTTPEGIKLTLQSMKKCGLEYSTVEDPKILEEDYKVRKLCVIQFYTKDNRPITVCPIYNYPELMKKLGISSSEVL